MLRCNKNPEISIKGKDQTAGEVKFFAYSDFADYHEDDALFKLRDEIELIELYRRGSIEARSFKSWSAFVKWLDSLDENGVQISLKLPCLVYTAVRGQRPSMQNFIVEAIKSSYESVCRKSELAGECRARSSAVARGLVGCGRREHEASPTAGARGYVLTRRWKLPRRPRREDPDSVHRHRQDAVGPGYDLHLVQLEGPLAEQVGVASGMSGSPVFVNEKLIGALSYRMGSLPKEPIGGVTPVEDMRAAGRAAAGMTQAAYRGATPIATPIAAGGLAAELAAWARAAARGDGLPGRRRRRGRRRERLGRKAPAGRTGRCAADPRRPLAGRNGNRDLDRRRKGLRLRPSVSRQRAGGDPDGLGDGRAHPWPTWPVR